jgi:hypothetical protein
MYPPLDLFAGVVVERRRRLAGWHQLCTWVLQWLSWFNKQTEESLALFLPAL